MDFPGFGESPRPVAEWGTADYADASAGLLESLPNGHRIWVGHSFGCRVGIQLAARHSEIIDALFLVAAAGLPRRRSRLSQFRIKSKIALYKGLHALPFELPARPFFALRHKERHGPRASDAFVRFLSQDPS